MKTEPGLLMGQHERATHDEHGYRMDSLGSLAHPAVGRLCSQPWSAPAPALGHSLNAVSACTDVACTNAVSATCTIACTGQPSAA